MAKQQSRGRKESGAARKVSAVEAAYVVESYLIERNFTRTLTEFRGEAAAILNSLKKAPNGVRSLSSILYEYVVLRESHQASLKAKDKLEHELKEEKIVVQNERNRTQELVQGIHNFLEAHKAASMFGEGSPILPGVSKPVAQLRVVNVETLFDDSEGNEDKNAIVGANKRKSVSKSKMQNENFVLNRSHSSNTVRLGVLADTQRPSPEATCRSITPVASQAVLPTTPPQSSHEEPTEDSQRGPANPHAVGSLETDVSPLSAPRLSSTTSCHAAPQQSTPQTPQRNHLSSALYPLSQGFVSAFPNEPDPRTPPQNCMFLTPSPNSARPGKDGIVVSSTASAQKSTSKARKTKTPLKTTTPEDRRLSSQSTSAKRVAPRGKPGDSALQSSYANGATSRGRCPVAIHQSAKQVNVLPPKIMRPLNFENIGVVKDNNSLEHPIQVTESSPTVLSALGDPSIADGSLDSLDESVPCFDDLHAGSDIPHLAESLSSIDDILECLDEVSFCKLVGDILTDELCGENPLCDENLINGSNTSEAFALSCMVNADDLNAQLSELTGILSEKNVNHQDITSSPCSQVLCSPSKLPPAKKLKRNLGQENTPAVLK